jgi:putative endonuclease
MSSPTHARLKAETAGRRAEKLAALYLQLKGYVILDRRVKTGRGEVDLIARRKTTLAFVEVKMRRNWVDRANLLAPRQLNRIINGATTWAAQRSWTRDFIWRYDLILMVPWHWPDHLEDAWRPLNDPTLEVGAKGGNVNTMHPRRK